jgi:hypothetical protein
MQRSSAVKAVNECVINPPGFLILIEIFVFTWVSNCQREKCVGQDRRGIDAAYSVSERPEC